MRTATLVTTLLLLPIAATAFVSPSSIRHDGQRRLITTKKTTALVVPPTSPSFLLAPPLRMAAAAVAGVDDMSPENKAYLAELQKRVERINALEPTIEELGDDELAAKTDEFKKRLANGEDINGPLLEEAFAVVREAAWRVLELRHYDVQILGGLILHEGRLAEMATGEGKTLVATLPSYLNGLLEGKSSYIVTVNDYLAKRDMEKMGQIHRYLGLSVGLIQSNMKEDERKKQYNSDVVYVTNSELGFDYLRDHLAVSEGQTVLPTGGEFDGFCIVDEADSVLIDEARTPLIISKQVPASSNKYQTSVQLADALQEGRHYEVDLKNKAVTLTELGFEESQNALGIDSLFMRMEDDGEAWAPYITNAVKAKELFNKDVDYTILKDTATNEDNGIGIIDSFTGRVLDGRRWTDGLHQSIEAKENIPVSNKSQVIAKVTYQSLFRQFSRLAGMTGTALADAAELLKTYDLEVVQVPTALPVARRDYPDVAFKTREAANNALIKEVINVGGGDPEGRPCLIGTTSVAASEDLVQALAAKNITASLLNASPKNAPRESELIAQAGRAGVVTVATNMAGRGTDILLGGCPKTMARIKTRSVLVDEGKVLSAEEAAYLPPSPPDSYFPCELDDDTVLLLKEAGAALRKDEGLTAIGLDELLTTANDATESEDDTDAIIKVRAAAEAVKEAYTEVLETEKEIVKALGGLYVMGTQRHESSRIDRQLRGRSGRQGDPGSSRFFLSFEDDMFQVFGGDQFKNMLETFRVADDMPVEAPQVTEAMDKVQEAVEEKFREIRTEILNFDETLNNQRSSIYKLRQKILFDSPEDTIETMKGYHKELISEIVNSQVDKESSGGAINTSAITTKVGQFFPGVALPSISGNDVDAKSITNKVTDAVNAFFDKKMMDMEEAATAEGRPANPLARSANYVALITMDNAWSDHLQTMEDLKEIVVMKQFQGVDPAAEYRRMSFDAYEGLLGKMRNNAVYSLWQSLVPQEAPAAAAAAQTA